MTKQTFKVGDQVILTEDVDGLLPGSIGTIAFWDKDARFGSIEVIQAISKEGEVWTGHNGMYDSVKSGRGWNVWIGSIEPSLEVNYNPNQQKDEEDDI